MRLSARCGAEEQGICVDDIRGSSSRRQTLRSEAAVWTQAKSFVLVGNMQLDQGIVLVNLINVTEAFGGLFIAICAFL